MKKNLLHSILFTLLISGCSQEEILNNQPTYSNLPIVEAGFEQAESRTYIEDGKYLRWNKDDQISFFYKSTLNLQYQFDGDTGDNAGTFSPTNQIVGTGNDLDCNYAVYPYNSDAKISEGGIITTTLPSVQSYAENSFGLGANTMVAATQSIDDTFLRFKNVGGYLKLQLYGDDVTIKSITLTGNNNEKLAREATITPVYGQDPTISMTNNATNSITLDCGEGVKIGSTVETATAFWIVVPPTSFDGGFTITITDINDGTFEKSTSNRIVIERNVIKPMTALPVEIETIHLVKTVNVSTAGELYKQISNTEKYNINSIKISGNLNGTDVRYIREMIGRDVNNNKTEGKLVNLDLSEASIVEGGDTYYEDSSIQCNTSDNIIGNYMFYYCDKLQNLILPNNVTAINWRAFSGCGDLASINIPNGITLIGQSAFGNCISLTSIDIPNSVTTIDYGAFYGCN